MSYLTNDKEMMKYFMEKKENQRAAEMFSNVFLKFIRNEFSQIFAKAW